MTFNVALNTEQFDLLREAIKEKYPDANLQFTLEMNRVGIHAIEGAMPPGAKEAALDVLMTMPLPTVQEVNHVIPKTHKPMPQRIVRGEVRVERAVGGSRVA